jgi:hypothetical protein
MALRYISALWVRWASTISPFPNGAASPRQLGNSVPYAR